MISKSGWRGHLGLHGGRATEVWQCDGLCPLSASKAMMIAIVDDDEAVRIATRHLVESLGYKTRTFASAEEFLQWMAQEKWSCIISDVNMPGLNGLELQRRLADEGRRIPFIFLTAFPDRAIEDRALKAGATGFLGKPFDSRDLIACIEHAFRRGSEPRQH
jgi:FixJ family two-component response regulator